MLVPLAPLSLDCVACCYQSVCHSTAERMTRLTGLVLLLAVSSGAGVTEVLPRETTAYEDGRLELQLVVDPPDGQVTACSVRAPGQQDFTLLLEGQGGRLALLGQCGVRVQPVAKEDAGVWTLLAELKGTTSVSAQATVTVQPFSSSVVPAAPSVDEGGELRLHLSPLWAPNASRALSSCVAQLPTGERVTLAGKAAADNPTYDAAGGTLDAGWCGLAVAHVTERHHRGRWILEAADKATGVVYRGKAEVNVWLPKMAVEPGAVAAEEGEVAALRLVEVDVRDSLRDWVECLAVRPDGAVVRLWGSGTASSANLVTDPSVVPDGEQQCAVRVGPLDSQHSGRWQLQARTAAGSEVRAAATLTVRGPYRPPQAAPPVVVAVMGSRDVALDCGPEDALSCRLLEPGGDLAATFGGRCHHLVDRVRARHNGTWSCTALLPGYLHPVNDSTTLLLAEPVHTDVRVEAAGVGWVLRCRLAGQDACARRPDFCRWDSPGGAPLLLREGVVVPAGRYRYTGQGLRACDCSMAIDGPLQSADLGVWRCVIGFKGSRSRGGLLAVSRAAGGRQSPRALEEVVVETRSFRSPAGGVARRGAVVVVGCRAGRALSYCWLRTPRGEQLVLDESWSRDGLRYEGSGLELGECGLRVERATDLHSGTWRCGMGLAGGEQAAMDREVAVEMIVSDSLLVAVQPNVTAEAGGRAELSCRTALGEAVQYCRFQRPDGAGLHLADDVAAAARTEGRGQDTAAAAGRYRYSGTGLHLGSCALLIEDLADEDFGMWTCGVGLAGDTAGLEQTADLHLLRQEGGGVAEAAMVGVCVGLLVIVLGAAGVLSYRRYASPRRRQARQRRRRPSLDSDSNELQPQAPSWTAGGVEGPSVRQTRSATTRLAQMTSSSSPSTPSTLPHLMPSSRVGGGDSSSSPSPTSSRKQQ